MIIYSILNIILLLFLLKIERKVTKGDVFSAGSFFIYFAFLPAFSNIYFSFFQERFNDIVLSSVATQYRDMKYVYLALVMQLIGNCVLYIGILFGYQSKEKFSLLVLRRVFLYNLLEDKNRIEYKNKILFTFGLIVFILGVLIFVKFITILGGLSHIWANLEMRSVMNAGLGYYQAFYTIAIQFGSFVLLYVFFKKKKYIYATLLIFIVVLILGSMGARGPILHYLISLLILYHYKFYRVGSLLNYKLVAMYLTFPVFIVVMLQFRTDAGTESRNIHEVMIESIDSFEQGFIARVGRLERDIVILKYFNEHDLWWGKSYLGILLAPIPRTMYPDKPPVDSGLYLRTIAAGIDVDPPLSVHELSNSSWPEHNWAGYMNWGLVGFAVLFFLSGYMLGRLYMYMKRLDFPIFGTLIYGYFIFGGEFLLDPYTIVGKLIMIVILNMLALFVFLPIKILMYRNVSTSYRQVIIK